MTSIIRRESNLNFQNLNTSNKKQDWGKSALVGGFKILVKLGIFPNFRDET